MGDIVPALNEEIALKFDSNMMRNRRAAGVAKRIQNGTATLYDGHEYAQALGESLSDALRTTLTEEALPDGIMYFNIADRTVKPALITNYNLVNDTASEIQAIVNKGVGLKAVHAPFPDGRIDGLIEKLCDSGLMWLGEAIINNTEAFFDDYILANAAARDEAGLTCKIVRKAASKCCKWCGALEGTYDYTSDMAGSDIFKRHEFCRCSVIYEDGKERQNVWTKSKWEASPEELRQRRDIRGRPKMSAREREEVIENGQKDRLKQKLRDAGFTSDQAESIYDQAMRRKRQWEKAVQKDANGVIDVYIEERIKKKRIADSKKLGGK